MSIRRSKRLLSKSISNPDLESPVQKKKTPKIGSNCIIELKMSPNVNAEVQFKNSSKPEKSKSSRYTKSSYFESPVESDDSDSKVEFVSPRRKEKPRTSSIQPKRKSILELAATINKTDESGCSKSQTELNDYLVNKLTQNVKNYESESCSSSDESDEIGIRNQKPLVSSDVNDKIDVPSPDSKPDEFFDFASLLSQVSETANQVDTKSKNGGEKEKSIKKVSSEKKSNRMKRVSESKNTKSNKEEMEVFELLAMGENTDMSAKDIKESVSKVQKEYEIPKQVEIVLNAPFPKKKKKCDDLEMALRRRLNNIRRESQVYVHKVHTLCWIAHGIHLNRTLNSPDLLSTALSLLPNEKCYPPKRMNLEYLEDLINWFNKKFKLKKEPFEGIPVNLIISLQSQFQNFEADTKLDLCFMFICMIRALGVQCRLMINLNTAPIKPTSEQLLPVTQKKENDHISNPSTSKAVNCIEKKDKKKVPSGSINNRQSVSKKENKAKNEKSKIDKRASSVNETLIELDNDSKTSKRFSSKPSTSKYFNDDKSDKKNVKPKRRTTSRKSVTKTKKKKDEDDVEKMSDSDSYDSAEEFLSHKQRKKIDRRVLSPDEENIAETTDSSTNKTLNKMNYWIEVYLEAEEKWTSVDINKKNYLCDEDIYKSASHPVRYILAWNNNQTIKDVTRRYVPQFLTVTRKLRADDAWWSETLRPYKAISTPREREEDEELEKKLEEQPLPTSISEFKNHPLYVLERHLLKFQAIYPSDAPPLGYTKGEPVYSRLCVHQLHGREMWIKEAKVVKMNEKPYKIVKGRPKRDKFGNNESPADLELFGIWQVEDYVPPTAENGKVPRNAFGNVELFKRCMLPKGTVYLQLPGLQKIANKLNIDCAAAITGFDYSTNGWSYPIKEGFVVCEEFKDILLDAYNQEVEEAERKEKQKNEKRIYGNWKRLIRGLFIAERLEKKYRFKDPGTSKQTQEN